MSNDPSRYGDPQPVIPSDRVTEAELLACESGRMEIEYDGSRLALISKTVRKLALEIRRYRAMLLGLVEHGAGLQAEGEEADGRETCFFCGEWTYEPHKADCVWAPVEAEVAAIRSERKRSDGGA